MNLKFVCLERFEIAPAICSNIQLYVPNLIYNIEIIRSQEFRGHFDLLDILPKIERIIKPEWDKDIVVVVINGSLYLADLEMFDAVGLTLDFLSSPSSSPHNAKVVASKKLKLGAQLLPNNMSGEPRRDVGYWAKLAVEEILHYFSIPEQHDVNCFYHSMAFGEATVEDCWKNYCPKCLEFMRHLRDPIDFAESLEKMEEIYLGE